MTRKPSRRRAGSRQPVAGSLAAFLLITSCVHRTAPSEPSILSRAEWGAAPAVGAMKGHTPDRITIHHTATPQNPERSLVDKLRGLQRFSQSAAPLEGGATRAAWPDIPYHYYIAADGAVGEGREVGFAGDSNTPYDPAGHLLIVVEGNFENEEPTAAQWESLVGLTDAMARRWSIPAERIAAHRDFAETLCPGRSLYARIPLLREAVRDGR